MEHQQQYVDIDLHRHRSVIVHRNGEGETLDTVHIDNDPYRVRPQRVTKSGAKGPE